VNETVFIKTTQGRFVMRRNQRRQSVEIYHYRHELIAWLTEQGFCCPHLIPTREGETLLTLEGRTYEITPYFDTKDYDPNRSQHLTQIGQTLAEYHQAIRGFDATSGEQPPRYHPQDIMALSERLLERDMMGDLTIDLKWYDVRAATLRSILPDELYTKLPHLVVHGDIHRDNFLFNEDRVVALIDYDQATWDARITDLADAVVGFTTDPSAFRNQMTWGVYKGPFDENMATQLIAAYHSVAPLLPNEIVALPKLIELAWLQGELGRVFSTPEGSPEYHQDVLGQGRWLSNWISERTDRLIRRWSNLGQEVPFRMITASAA